MSQRVTSTQLFSGSHVVSLWAGLGIPGAQIPTAGDSGGSPLANDGILAGAEYRLVVIVPPSAGVLIFYPDTSCEFSGAPDGAYSFTYQGFENSVSIGSATSTLNVDAAPGVAAGGVGTSVGAGSGGSASGVTNATTTSGIGTGYGSGSGGMATGDSAGSVAAPGATGTGVGSGSGGTATAIANTTAPGGTGAGTGSGSGGNAAGLTADAIASGSSGTSTGSGHGGVAYGSGDSLLPGPDCYRVKAASRASKIRAAQRNFTVKK